MKKEEYLVWDIDTHPNVYLYIGRKGEKYLYKVVFSFSNPGIIGNVYDVFSSPEFYKRLENVTVIDKTQAALIKLKGGK